MTDTVCSTMTDCRCNSCLLKRRDAEIDRLQKENVELRALVEEAWSWHDVKGCRMQPCDWYGRAVAALGGEG